MPNISKIGDSVKRSDKVMFLNTGTEQAPTFQRMQGFTSLVLSKNPKEYTRQYVDESFERTDATGYSPSIAFSFDEYAGNAVLEKLAGIIDNESLGTDAMVQVLQVNLNTANTDNAWLREFSVVADNEGSNLDLYDYNGNFNNSSDFIWGTAEVSADGLTATFTASA